LPPIKELNECERYFADLILFFRGENVSDPNVATMWFYSGKGMRNFRPFFFGFYLANSRKHIICTLPNAGENLSAQAVGGPVR
jgi:hypothetical protein